MMFEVIYGCYHKYTMILTPRFMLWIHIYQPMKMEHIIWQKIVGFYLVPAEQQIICYISVFYELYIVY